MAKAKDTEYFLEKARKVHGDKYDYSLVDYKLSKEKVKIICPHHGVFEQKAGAHLIGQGCKSCVKGKTTEQFVKEAVAVHGNKFTYENVKYSTNETLIEVTCPIHGGFKIRPSSHLYGRGCNVCSPIVNSLEKFILKCSEIHQNKYDYSLVKYTKWENQVDIICPVHGKFSQVADYHLSGRGCKQCADDNSSYIALRRCAKDDKFAQRQGCFYLLNIFSEEEQFLKVGISSNMNDRIRKYNKDFNNSPYFYEILLEFVCDNKSSALIEKSLLETFKSEKIMYKPLHKFAGHTECVKASEYKYIEEVIAKTIKEARFE